MPAAKTLHPAQQIDAIFQAALPIQALLDVAASHQVKPYLVGGAVRDALYYGRLSQDIDAVVPMASSRTISHALAERLDGKCILLDEQYQIYRIILFPGLEMMDIAGCIGPDIHTDLHRRDFTVNAMAYDLETRTVLDPTGGQVDLAAGVLRMVSEKNLLDDPLRLLRLFRIGAELGFLQTDLQTLAVVKKHAPKVLQAAPERIHYELMRLFSVETCFAHVRLMADIGILEVLFPELSPCRHIPPNQYHHLGLFDHTLELVDQAEQHFSDLPEAIQTHLLGQVNPFTKRMALVRLACLFHDIGKPATMAYDAETGRYKFYRHEEVSEELTLAIAHRMKWGKDITKAVAQLVRYHLYPGDMLRPGVSLKAHRKFFRRVADVLPEMILLSIADRYSAQGPLVTPEELAIRKAGLIALWDKYHTMEKQMALKPKLLTGHDVMQLLGVPGGPHIGQILQAVDEAFLNGEIHTAADAENWVKQHFQASSRIS